MFRAAVPLKPTFASSLTRGQSLRNYFARGRAFIIKYVRRLRRRILQQTTGLCASAREVGADRFAMARLQGDKFMHQRSMPRNWPFRPVLEMPPDL